MSQTDYEKSCGICGMIPHHSKCRVRELETKLAEANTALLHMEADRDGCLKIMFSSQHGKKIRELQIEVTRLRSQLAESEATLAATQKELANRIHTELDASERARQSAAQLERSPCGVEGHRAVDLVMGQRLGTRYGLGDNREMDCLACKREADAVRRGLDLAAKHLPLVIMPEGIIGCCCGWSLFDYKNTLSAYEQWANHIRALAPASQPTEATMAEILFPGIRDLTPEERESLRAYYQKRFKKVASQPTAEHAKEGEK